MRARIAVAAPFVAFALSGCAMVWVKPGATQAEFNQDSYQCQQDAANMYPAAIVQNTAGSGYRAPSQTTCSTYGGYTNCTTQPGAYVAPVTYTTDANSGNRNQAYNSCMVARGYSLKRKQ